MTVQEVFRKLHREDIVSAYIYRYGIQDDSWEVSAKSLEEKLLLRKKEKASLRTFVNTLCECVPKAPEKPQTLCIVEYKDIDITNKAGRTLTSFTVYDEEIKKFLKENRQDTFPDTYGYDFSPIDTIAGIRIADTSINNLTPLAITTEILNEIAFFGIDEEQRLNRIQEITEELEAQRIEIEENKKSGKPPGIPAEVVFQQLREKYLHNCQTEEERQYAIYKHEFQDKVHEIEMRYAEQIIRENQQISKDFYCKEFLA